MDNKLIWKNKDTQAESLGSKIVAVKFKKISKTNHKLLYVQNKLSYNLQPVSREKHVCSYKQHTRSKKINLTK